ncbi:MAG TPA: hypothetical protein EYP19_15385 [Desulfobacterales bacterium]|nr:hypothetical protein [Desulfobacterales bacterium]
MSCYIYNKCERGGAPTFAVFAVFIIICSSVAIAYFQAARQREASTIQGLMAADVTRAAASSIRIELNEALVTAITAAMYEVGIGAGTKENVEEKVREYLNSRISCGWIYPNIKVDVPYCDENSLVFRWQPDGSVAVWGYLGAWMEHVEGPAAYGVELHAAPYPRFLRLKHVAGQVGEQVARVHDLNAFENELNDNYACEGLRIELFLIDNVVSVEVLDIYGGRSVILGE